MSVSVWIVTVTVYARLEREENLIGATAVVEILDTFIAFMIIIALCDNVDALARLILVQLAKTRPRRSHDEVELLY